MEAFGLHEWAGVILLISSGFSSANGSLVPDPPTLFFAGLTVAGLFICEQLLFARRQRRRQPAPVVVRGHWRN